MNHRKESETWEAGGSRAGTLGEGPPEHVSITLLRSDFRMMIEQEKLSSPSSVHTMKVFLHRVLPWREGEAPRVGNIFIRMDSKYEADSVTAIFAP